MTVRFYARLKFHQFCFVFFSRTRTSKSWDERTENIHESILYVDLSCNVGFCNRMFKHLLSTLKLCNILNSLQLSGYSWTAASRQILRSAAESWILQCVGDLYFHSDCHWLNPNSVATPINHNFMTTDRWSKKNNVFYSVPVACGGGWDMLVRNSLLCELMS